MASSPLPPFAMLLSALLLVVLSISFIGGTQGLLSSPVRTTAGRSMVPMTMRNMRTSTNCRNISPKSMALSEQSQKRADALGIPKVDVDPMETMFYQVPDSVPKLGEKYAVVEVGGSQVIVEEGRWYTVNRLKANVGDVIRLPRVLLMKMAQDKVQLGLPYLEEAVVEAQVVEHLRGEKLTAGKYKPKKHYRRKWGVRDELTKFVVTKIHTDSTDFIPNLNE
mmetsp:Transcript_33225/g.46368  ORF Transcript_33225/g.46368 Transcript_33225/m.46368 type:complete len:222 (+) Transcript_33225:46-711(+)